MAETYAELASHRSIASLMEHLHAPGGDALARFRIIRTLVVAAQSDLSFRSTAQVIVILALWPGLDAVFWRLARGFPDDRDTLCSEILARVSEAMLVLNLAKVTAVTATLLRNVERDIRRDLIDTRAIGEASVPIYDEMVEAEATAASGLVAVADRGLEDHLLGLGLDDTNLLNRVFTLGETQEEAGRALGLSPAASRKRIQRTLQKLRILQESSTAMSHFVPPFGL